MNSVVERWIGSCRRELLDRTLVWNQRHLMTVLREYEDFYNTHRPHRALKQAAPLRPLPIPSPAWTSSESSGVTALVGCFMNIAWWHRFRHPQGNLAEHRIRQARVLLSVHAVVVTSATIPTTPSRASWSIWAES
jgi:hypothetical protein